MPVSPATRLAVANVAFRRSSAAASLTSRLDGVAMPRWQRSLNARRPERPNSCASPAAIDDRPDRPCVVLAEDASRQLGAQRQAVLRVLQAHERAPVTSGTGDRALESPLSPSARSSRR